MKLTRTIIRCQIDVGSRSDNFTDVATGKPPAFFAGDDLEWQIGFFYNGQLLDIGNFSSVTLLVQQTAVGGATLMSKTLGGALLNKTLTLADWQSGANQHASIIFTNAETGISTATTHYIEAYGVTTSGGSFNETFGKSILTVQTSGRGSAAAAPIGNPAYLTADQIVGLLGAYLKKNADPGDLLSIPNAANTYKTVIGTDIDGNPINNREAIL